MTRPIIDMQAVGKSFGPFRALQDVSIAVREATILGIIGPFLATYLGQAIGWYRAGEGAGLIGAIVGAVIVLLIWSLISGRRSA